MRHFTIALASMLCSSCVADANEVRGEQDASQGSVVVPPELAFAAKPFGNEACGEWCTSSYPTGCNSVCSVCGTGGSGTNGKCVHGLP